MGTAFETLFETYLDPRSIPADRAGRPVRVDLSRYAGREVELFFSTDPGPKGDLSGDFAGWAGIRFVGGNEAPPKSDFEKIYAGEALVYEVPNVLPRAALFRSIEVVPDDAALARLKDASFNSFEKALVSRESVPNGVNLSALIEARAGSAVGCADYELSVAACCDRSGNAGAGAAGSQRHQLSRLARLCERAAG